MKDEAIVESILEHTHFRANGVGERRYFPGETRRHHSPDSLLLLVDQGRTRVKWAGGQFEASEGDLVIFPMDTPFSTTTDKGFSVRYAEFDLFISDHRSVIFRLITFQKKKGFKSLPLGQLLEDALTHALRAKPFYRSYLNGVLAVVISRTLELRPGRGEEDLKAMRVFAPVLDLIRHRHHERLSTRALAAMTGLNESYFCSYFKKTFGVSPLQYVQRVKMYTAQKWLREKSLSVNEVAQKLGFEDAATFSRTFRRIYQVPPSQITRSSSGLGSAALEESSPGADRVPEKERSKKEGRTRLRP